MPVKPATKKKKIKKTIAKVVGSTRITPFMRLRVQLTTFIVAGRDIIIVNVLYKARLL